MVSLIQKLTRKVNRTVYKFQHTRAELQRMSQDMHPLAKPVERALTATLNRRLTSDEQHWVNKIEQMRNRLDSSQRKIEHQNINGQKNTIIIGEFSRQASKRPLWGMMMFKLIRELRPENCIEMGSCFGISAAYQTAALEINNSGKLAAIEGIPAFAQLAQNNLRGLNLTRVNVVNGWFQDVLSDVLEKNKPISFAFIDGHHDEKATIRYFHQMIPFLSDKAVLVFDDTTWSKGMERAWLAISSDKRVSLVVDLFTMGLCIVEQSPQAKARFKIALD